MTRWTPPLLPRLLAAGLLLVAAMAQAEDTPAVEQCPKKLGVLAVAEPQQG